MITLEQTRQHLETQDLKQLTYPEILDDLLGAEVTTRREALPLDQDQAGPPALPAHPGAVRLRLPSLHRRAPEPAPVKTGSRNWPAWPSWPRPAHPARVPHGVGKTHLAVALAMRAIENGYGAYFVRAHDLMEDLRKAHAEHNLDRRMRIHLSPKVLVLRPGRRHRFHHTGLRQVRAGQHHPDLQQGVRRVARRHRHRCRCPGRMSG